jgi:hypothetical protein
MPNSKAVPIEASIYQVIKEASLLYCIPTTPLQEFFQKGQLSGKPSSNFSPREHLRVRRLDLCAAFPQPLR